MEKLNQMKSENKSSKFKLFTPGLVSLEHHCQHKIHLKNLYFTPLELLVTAFSKWVLAPEKFTLHESWEHDQKFNPAALSTSARPAGLGRAEVALEQCPSPLPFQTTRKGYRVVGQGHLWGVHGWNSPEMLWLYHWWQCWEEEKI